MHLRGCDTRVREGPRAHDSGNSERSEGGFRYDRSDRLSRSMTTWPRAPTLLVSNMKAGVSHATVAIRFGAGATVCRAHEGALRFGLDPCGRPAIAQRGSRRVDASPLLQLQPATATMRQCPHDGPSPN